MHQVKQDHNLTEKARKYQPWGKIMWSKVGYIKCSKHRTKVAKSLIEEPKIPSQIVKEVGLNPYKVSAALKQLREKDIVVCLNPEVKKGRLYQLTNTGREVLKYV